MTLSVLLRLIPEALARGEVKGHATAVATGQQHLFRNLGELNNVLSALVDAPQTDTLAGTGEGHEGR